MVYMPLQAVRVGLLARFFGTLGMALGVSIILLSPRNPAAGAVDRVAGPALRRRAPGGRPPAWEAGEAIPWVRPGEEQASERSAGALGGEAIEGEATEVPADGESRGATGRPAGLPQAQAQAPPLAGHSP